MQMEGSLARLYEFRLHLQQIWQQNQEGEPGGVLVDPSCSMLFTFTQNGGYKVEPGLS